MPVESARENSTIARDATLGGTLAAGSLRVFVLGADPAERKRLAELIGAARGLSGYDPLSGAGDAGARRVPPEVVVLVLDPNAPDAERRLREALDAWRPAPLLVLSEDGDGDANRALVRKGARGVVPRARESDHLVTAIRKVSGGEIWLSRASLSRIIDEIATSAGAPAPPVPVGVFATLTERERDVAGLIAEGLHNRAIAGKLGITENTVRHHLTAIYGKLGVADRLELAVLALRHRLGGHGDNRK
jgi:two-component system nitrate/nitrite response regulator NarL